MAQRRRKLSDKEIEANVTVILSRHRMLTVLGSIFLIDVGFVLFGYVAFYLPVASSA